MGTMEQITKSEEEEEWGLRSLIKHNVALDKPYVGYLIMQIETLQEYDHKIPQSVH